MNESRLVYSCSFFLLSFVLIVVSKPDFIFDRYGRLKHFGTGRSPNKTLAPLGVVTVILATLCFYMFCILDMVLS